MVSTTKLRDLKIDSETLLELIKSAVARGELMCEGLSSGVRVYRHGEYEYYCGGHNIHTGSFGLTVETEDEMTADGDLIPLLRVEVK